jgi:hypothetical protein
MRKGVTTVPALRAMLLPPSARQQEVGSMTAFIRNQWYVAAYGRELGRELLSGTICGESILFWRTEAGAITEIDMFSCPERVGKAASRLRSSGR